jgi:hypothetical protein
MGAGEHDRLDGAAQPSSATLVPTPPATLVPTPPAPSADPPAGPSTAVPGSGDGAGTAPVTTADPPANTPLPPWSAVRLGAEPVVTRTFGSADGRPIVHDGVGLLDNVGTMRVSSPRCGHPLTIDLASVIGRGTGRLAFSAAAPDALVDDVARAFKLQQRDFDGRLVLVGTSGMAPSFAVLRCDSCDQLHLAVASYGELEPAHYQVAFEGVIPIDRVAVTTGELPVITPAGSPAATSFGGSGDRPSPLGAPSGVGGTARPAEGPRPAASATPRRHPLPPPLPTAEAHRPGRRIGTGIVALLVVAVLAGLHASAGVAWSRSKDLANTGVLVQATVTATDASHGPGAEDRYAVSYQYTALAEHGGATTESGEQDIDAAGFQRAQRSGTIPVRYDAGDPAHSAIARHDDITGRVLLVVIADLLLLGAAVWLVRRRGQRSGRYAAA